MVTNFCWILKRDIPDQIHKKICNVLKKCRKDVTQNNFIEFLHMFKLIYL